MHMFTLFITGSTGKVGKEVVKLLIRENVTIKALIRNQERAEWLKSQGIIPVPGDMDDITTYQDTLNNVDKLLLIGPDHPDQITREQPLIDAARHAGIKHIIKVSAFVAGLTPPVSIGKQLSEIELHLKNSGIPWTIIRPFMFMQNFLEFSKLIKANKLFAGPFGKGRVNMVDTRDVAELIRKVVLGHGYEQQTLEVTGPSPLSFYDAARILSEETGNKIRFLSVPPFLAGMAMRQEGISKWEVIMRLELFKVLKSGVEDHTNNTFMEITGRPPKTFRDFVKDHIHSFRKTGEKLAT